MRAEVARVRGVASDAPSFRALDLNQAISVRRGKWSARLTISGPASLEARLRVEDPRYVGLDIGEAGSRDSGVRVLAADGCAADLAGVRGHADADSARASETARTIPPCSGGASCGPIRGARYRFKAFVADVRADLADAVVRGAYADAYRAGELRDCSAVAVDGRAVRDGTGRLGGGARVPASCRTDGRDGAAEQSEPRPARSKNRPSDGTANGNPAIDSGAVAWPD